MKILPHICAWFVILTVIHAINSPPRAPPATSTTVFMFSWREPSVFRIVKLATTNTMMIIHVNPVWVAVLPVMGQPLLIVMHVRSMMVILTIRIEIQELVLSLVLLVNTSTVMFPIFASFVKSSVYIVFLNLITVKLLMDVLKIISIINLIVPVL